jgi:hypothetical protein
MPRLVLNDVDVDLWVDGSKTSDGRDEPLP